MFCCVRIVNWYSHCRNIIRIGHIWRTAAICKRDAPHRIVCRQSAFKTFWSSNMHFRINILHLNKWWFIQWSPWSHTHTFCKHTLCIHFEAGLGNAARSGCADIQYYQRSDLVCGRKKNTFCSTIFNDSSRLGIIQCDYKCMMATLLNSSRLLLLFKVFCYLMKWSSSVCYVFFSNLNTKIARKS